jgi:autotransporter-associated beta strand protein
MVALGLFHGTLLAATSIKQNNNTKLNLTGSWNAMPGMADIGQWDATVLAANSPALGSDLTWLGLKITTPGGLVTLGAGNTLTLGASGIDMGTATQNLTLNCGLTLQGKQSWLAASGRTLNVAGLLTRTGAVVDFTGFNAAATLGTLTNDVSGILGAWATTGSGATLNYARSTAGAVSAFTAQTAATAVDLSNVSNPAVNYSLAAGATMTGAISANTLRATGGAVTVATGGFSSTLNGLMVAGTGDVTMSGVGSLVIGPSREVVIQTNTQSATILCPVVNNGAGASSLTFAGGSAASALTLSGPNTYSGGTSVTSGTFFLGSQTGMGTGPANLAAGTTFQQTNFEGNSAAGSIPNTLVLSGIGNVIFNMPFGGGKDIWLSQPVSGTGGITVQGGTRSLTLTASNNFNGGIRLTNADNKIQISHVNALGTGTFRTERLAAANGHLMPLTNLDTGTGVRNAFDIAPGAFLNLNTNGFNLLISGSITGTGTLHKAAGGTLTLSGANTYSGPTKVTAGIVSCSTPFSLGTGALDITTGAKLNLNYTGTRRISALTLNAGASQANGTYGSTASPAMFANDTYFSGTGTVTVGPAGATTTATLALTAGSSPAAVGASLTFRATVAGTAPAGSVAFYDGVSLIGPGTLDASFQASVTTSTLALGSHAITVRYLGNATNEPSVSAPLTVQVVNPADIVSFVFPGLPATTITGTNISAAVPFSTNVTALAPTYTTTAGATGSPASGTPLDFTTPQSYVITGADGSVKTFTVTVTKAVASAAKDITSFNFAGLPVTTIGASTVALTVPFGTAVASLAPTYTVSALASGSPVSGTARDFTSPQTYTITAENGSTKTYTMTVTVAPASTARDMLTCNFGVLGPATITGTTATLTVVPTQPVTALAPTFTLSPFATISPASGSTQDFTNPVTYTVTAQNGTTQSYTVVVQSFDTWARSGSLFVITTPEGANIPAGLTETDFPVLIRLNSGTFNFAEAQPDGRDIRFTTAAGTVLSYQIEQWDTAAGQAAIWVKLPTITGNARQELKMYWGKAGVATQSNGAAVFNAANGYATVIHMNETVQDAAGTVTTSDTGTTLASGMIGKGRNFPLGRGIWCGDNITAFPQGGGAHSTQAWFRTGAVNCEIVDWGVEGGGGAKVQVRVISPPRIYVDGNFASVTGTVALDTTWHHVAHTYTGGVARIYVDGQLDASAGVTMNLPNPSRMWIGGWYNNYSFAGDIDEVRISKVARSANWIKLEYENQKPLQTLMGTLVQAGSTFSAAPASVTFNEGTTATLTGLAGGAQKVYWIRRQGGVDAVLATDQFSLNIAPGRVTGSQSYVIQWKGIYPTGIQTVDIPVTVAEDLPDPVFTLAGPATWDGRQTIAVTADVSNLTAIQAKGVGTLNYTWTVNGVAAARQITPGTLTLTRAQGSGPMTVTLTMDNGGGMVTNTKTILVQEPSNDPYVQRTPGAVEIPVIGQFYARDDSGLGRIYYNGTQAGTPDTVFLKVYTTDTGDVLYATHRQPLVAGRYAFTAPVAAGRVTYKVVYGTTTGGVDTVVNTVTHLVCGDAYIFQGQSNAVATDSLPSNLATDPWIRTYGHTTGTWGNAVRNGSDWWIGYFAWPLAQSLSTEFDMPICIINGAVGGTRIDQHQANPANHAVAGSSYAIYANLLNRVAGAKLTHGIRGIFWHQGENNSGAAAPTGDYDYKSYQQYFVDMSAAWKQDYPNFERSIIFQVMPKPCSMGPKGDQLRNEQRLLPRLYSKMHILDTLGVAGYIGCHFTAAGYQNMANRTLPLVRQDYYGVVPAASVTAPNLQRAWFPTAARNEVALEFDQPMNWNSVSATNYYFNKVMGKVASGSALGRVVKLQLNSAIPATATIDYLEDDLWNFSEPISSLLAGTNGIAALTFSDEPIGPPPTAYDTWASAAAQGLTAGVNNGPLQDPDNDGIANLLEFALGTAPMSASSAMLPSLTASGANWTFQYDRSDLSLPPATTQMVEYGSDLIGWTQVPIPATSAGPVTITPGTPSDRVSVSVPKSGAKTYVRLRVTN